MSPQSEAVIDMVFWLLPSKDVICSGLLWSTTPLMKQDRVEAERSCPHGPVRLVGKCSWLRRLDANQCVILQVLAPLHN